MMPRFLTQTAVSKARARECGTVIGKGGLILMIKFGPAGLHVAGDQISHDSSL